MDTWLDVFPELARDGDVEAARAELTALLARVDGVPSDLPRQRPVPPAASPRASTGVFGPIVGGLVEAAVRDGGGVPQHPVLQDRERLEERLRTLLIGVAEEHLTRPLLALLAEDARSGALRGATPEERYDDFVAALQTPSGQTRLDATYPDLLPRIATLLAQRQSAWRGQLAQTAAEWQRITRLLDLPADDVIVDVSSEGDPHGGGRCTLMLVTSSGHRAAMKPRSVRVETGYADFSRWLAHAAVSLELPSPAFAAAGDAGWMAYVGEPAGPTPPGPHYFTAMGVHLAALHLVRGTDMHYENVVTSSSGLPVVIDAEALFSPSVPSQSGDTSSRDDHTVTSTGLLSLPFGDTAAGFDFGALDYRSGRLSPFRAWHLINAFRDDMRLEMRPLTVDHPGALPADTRRGRQEAQAVLDAFVTTMTFAVRHRDVVREQIRRHFDGGRCRYIHRPTMTYALLLRMATHPRFADDADRQRVLGRVAVLAPESPWDLVASEIQQLTAGEIPAFTVDLDDTVVRDSRGRDTGVRTAQTPLATVEAALERLDHDHVRAQTDLLRSALAHWHPPAPPIGEAR